VAEVRRLAWLALTVSLVLGACTEPPGTVVLGGGVDVAALTSAVTSFGAMRAVKPGEEVVLEGTVGKVCPAGCWFYLHGPDDLVYVDVLGDFLVPQEATGQTAVIKGITDGDGGARILKAQRVLLSPTAEPR
jgi:hypothetical protein